MFRMVMSAVMVAGLGLPAVAPAQTSRSWFSWRPGQVIENALLFHPARQSDSWLSPPPGVQVQDVWLRTTDGSRIHAWWFPFPQAREVILFCHGNAGNLSHRRGVVLDLMQALHASVLIFDYPGYGRSTGKPSEAGCYAAADAAFAWLVQSGLAPQSIVLFGESLGGGVATDLAVRRSQRALVLVKTFTSIPALARRSWLTSASSSLVRNEFDNLAKIARCPAAIFLAHGNEDRVIPVAQGRQLFDAAPEPKQFFLLEGSDHNDPLPPAFFATLASFLEKIQGAH